MVKRADPSAPIGIFDSGLGGLTVAHEVMRQLPTESFVYFGDTARVPYGPKSPDTVRRYSHEICGFLLDEGVKAIVVACNTATAHALSRLRDELPVPVLGVIQPGARAAVAATRSGHIGVIGTVGTIASGAYQRAAARLFPGVELACAACPGFVEFVEAGDVDSDQVFVLAERLLAPVRAAGVDTLVLGCTHYPLLARTIGDVMGRSPSGDRVVLVSSGEETAFEVSALLDGIGARRRGGGPARRTFLTSGDPATFRALGTRFLGPEVEAVEAWTWS
jgi:glutamate racemase